MYVYTDIKTRIKVCKHLNVCKRVISSFKHL